MDDKLLENANKEVLSVLNLGKTFETWEKLNQLLLLRYSFISSEVWLKQVFLDS